MPIEKIIERYLQLIETRDFLEYENDFANRLKEGISKGYRQNLQEPKIVEAIVNKINKNRLSKTINRFHISTTGIFIHGPKSVVEFEYYGTNTKRELGDLIFIISVIYNNKKYFEKLTITQFKKSKEKPIWNFNNRDKENKYPDKEQLYLLSRFPIFKKIRGIIPKGKYSLPNYSHCLGSYGFLYPPNDFVFASAKIVEIFVENKNSISKEDIDSIKKMFIPNLLFYVSNKFPPNLYYKYPRRYKFIPIIDNIIHSYNVEDFTNNYLRSLIGELVFACKFPHNKEVFQFLQKLMKNIKGNKNYKEFIESFYKYKYCNEEEIKNFNNDNNNGHGGEKFEKSEGAEDGGIGIIHTTINLGEGR